MKFPKIGKLKKGGYYVMPILGNCTLHFPVPDDQGQAKALIAEVDAYTLKQQEIGDAKGSHMYNIEEPE